MTQKTIDFREHFRKNIIPKRYIGQLHLGFSLACFSTTFTIIALYGDTPGLIELLLAPLFLILGNLFVFVVHKYPLHRPLPFMKHAYQIHTKWHHSFFTEKLTTYDTPKDFFILFFPTWIVLGHCLLGVPTVYFAFSWAVSPGAGTVAAFMTALYFVLYEVVHYISHLPNSHPILRSSQLFSYLKEHHRAHHDPRLMGKFNFNIVFPLSDYIFKTYYKGRVPK